MSSPPAIVNLRMLFVCCILIAVKGGWDEEVGLLRRGGEQREFDYFKLALQWPGTYCRKTRHCCSSNACCTRSNSPSVFTIHGLWTEYNDGTWPSCCSGRPFDEKEISTLLEPMRKYWPSLSCGSPRSCHHKKGPFWGHEWEKHGTCAYPVVHDEYEFFLTTLNVYFKYNVTEVLFEAGYVPSNSEKYPLGGIISAIQNAFHTTPELVCSGDALEELRICFYKNFEPCDCAHDTSLRRSCPQYVSLPAHGSWDMIFFAMGFKSYDIARDESRAEMWYDWTERGRIMMSRASFSQKSMEWICLILKEASKVKGNNVRRWRRQEHVSHLFCARNFNNKGRYISIISIQGKSRAVLIVPEISFNAGWWDLDTKIEKFIHYKANKTVNQNYKMVDKEIPYAETVRRSRWSSREINSAA